MLYTFDSHTTLTDDIQNMSDELLMGEVQRENELALKELHRRHAATLGAVIGRVLHNEHSAEDLLQEVFLEIWRLASRYSREKGKALGWMITLARRRAIDRLRREQAYFRVEERFQKETESQPAAWTHNCSEENIESADLRQLLATVLETLPPAQKDAIELAFYKGLSQREIAAKTKIPLGTIKTRLELGIRKVAARLREMTDDSFALTAFSN